MGTISKDSLTMIFMTQSPSWSPDGKRIAFSSRRDGHFIGEFGLTSEIYVMDADGGNEQRLTENRKTDSSPSWSPDGKWIAFTSDRKGDDVNFEIYVMDADGENRKDSPIIALMTGLPHGLRTVNGLSSCLIRMGNMKTMKST